jgi:hypothetical protein
MTAGIIGAAIIAGTMTSTFLMISGATCSVICPVISILRFVYAPMQKARVVVVVAVVAEAITTGVETIAITVTTATTADVTGHTRHTGTPAFTEHLHLLLLME